MNLVVVFGGEAPEHEVSLAGARAVLSHAELLGWKVLPAGVSRDGRWFVGPGALRRLWDSADPHRLPTGNALTDRLPGDIGACEEHDGVPPASEWSGYELAFPVCHGRRGEDGTLQGLLSCLGLRVVGCGVAASAVCFDKHLTKSVLTAAGLPVARGVRVHRDDHEKDPGAAADLVSDSVGPGPWFVKPTSGGSSLGISRVDLLSELDKTLKEAFRWDSAALVEERVPHREMVVGVVGRNGGDLVVSPPGECIAFGELYTYEEKYRLGNARFTCPAVIDARLDDRARELAADAFRALGCSVFARVDLFLDERTGDFLINEVNTIPGLTEVSVFPKVMRAAGYSYAQMLAELCRLA